MSIIEATPTKSHRKTPVRMGARAQTSRPAVLDDTTTVREVERALHARRLSLWVNHDKDGFFVAVTRGKRRYLGLHASLIHALREALDEADGDRRGRSL